MEPFVCFFLFFYSSFNPTIRFQLLPYFFLAPSFVLVVFARFFLYFHPLKLPFMWMCV